FTELQQEAGRQFDPELVAVLISQKDELVKLLESHRERDPKFLRRKTDWGGISRNPKVVACA
ncbi:MAG: hypothetical protein U9Q58_00620, partial [Pseudomonadota bacterium]|nr:hypothetical protein [Pseudomonadota bacterium]